MGFIQIIMLLCLTLLPARGSVPSIAKEDPPARIYALAISGALSSDELKALADLFQKRNLTLVYDQEYIPFVAQNPKDDDATHDYRHIDAIRALGPYLRDCIDQAYRFNNKSPFPLKPSFSLSTPKDSPSPYSVLWAQKGASGAMDFMGRFDFWLPPFGKDSLIPTAEELHQWVKKNVVPQLPLLIGGQDLTSWHWVWHRLGVPSLYGPNLDHTSKKTLEKLTSSFHFNDLDVWQGLSEKPCKGKIIGGDMEQVILNLGTNSCQPSLDGYWLFVEGKDLAFQRYRDFLTALTRSGLLEKAHGVIFGHLTLATLSIDDVQAFAKDLLPPGLPLFHNPHLGSYKDCQPLFFGTSTTVTGTKLSIYNPYTFKL
jgi:hypothetical protein